MGGLQEHVSPGVRRDQEPEGQVTRKARQRSHDEYGPVNAHEAEVFLPYEAVVDRLEDAAKQLPGASVLHREGLAILRVGTASASDVNGGRPEI